MERAEVGCNDSIGDDRNHERIKRGAENRVLLARVADTDDMINIAEGELEELVGKNAGSVGETKQTVVSKDGTQAHGAGMQDSFVTQAAQTGMAVDDLNLLADDNVAEDGEEGKDSREGGLAVDDKKGHMVDLEAIGQVADASATLVLMCDDDDLVATVNELLRQLVNVTLDTSGLGEEEVADHRDVVRHDGGCILIACAV